MNAPKSAVIATAVLIALSLAGCAGDDEYGDAKARSVVTEFFDLLEVGDAEGASELLGSDLVITPGAAENDFYSDAIAHPSETEIVEAVGYDSFKVNVTVGYRLGNDPDPREVTVVVEREAGQFRITGWLGTEAVQIGKTDAPGVLEVNGSLTLALQKTQELLLLPGLYSFEYVDETGLTTLDPTTPKESTFEIAFPFDEGVVAPGLPEGVSTGFRSLVIEPQLRPDVLPAITDTLSSARDVCTGEGFVGPSCPPALADAVSTDDVDLSSVEWVELDAAALVRGGRVV